MTYCIHKATAKVRRITCQIGTRVHLAQVVKLPDGRTEYWADLSEVTLIPCEATPFDTRCAVFMQQMHNKKVIVKP